MENNKKVVLIAPGPHVVNYHYDLRDYIICRVGNVFPLTTKMISATGSVTHYWYPPNKLLKLKPNVCLDESIQKIRTTKKAAKLIHPDALHKWEHTRWDLDRLMKQVNCMPNRGLRAMIDILRHDPRELWLIGFTFYRGEPYYPGYTSPEHHQLTKDMKGDLGNHKQEPQIEYFRKYIMNNPVVRMDEELKKVMNRF